MEKQTPLVGTRGRYAVISPFTIAPNKVYVCKAIRSMKDLFQSEIDVYRRFYQPVGLDQEAYRNDVDNQANIITLISEEGNDGVDTVYVPDTYIASYPDMGNVEYKRSILSVDLGLLPEYVDLGPVKHEIQVIAAQVVGAEPSVKDHIVDHSGYISPSDHETFESTRLEKITRLETDRAKYMREKARTDQLSQRVQDLEQIIIDAGLLD